MFSCRMMMPLLVAGALSMAPALDACGVPFADPSLCAVTKAGKALAGAPHNERVVGLVEAAASHAGLKSAEGEALSAIPGGTVLHRIEFPQVAKNGDAEHVAIYLELPPDFVESGKATGFLLDRIGHEFIGALMEENISGYFLHILDPKTGAWLEPDEIAPPEVAPEYVEPVDHATVEMARALGKEPFRDLAGAKAVPVINPGQPQGSLSGKTVFINQSHGWFDDVDFGRWRVQRGNTCELMEDLNSAEFIDVFVMPMLRNAGAKVMTCRESDLQTNMVIVDNSDGTAFPARGSYVETGAWTTSSVDGFKQKTTASWTGVSINPFAQGTGQNRLSPGLTAGPNPTATATWVGNIPATGFYNVYASWSPFSARAQDAQYFVHHSGGVTEFRVDQTIDGYTWFLLGNFHFVAGSPESERKVVLTNVSSDGDAVNVSADAVRWGGGMGDFARHTHGISNRPRWEEEAVNYLQFTGMGRSGLHYTGTDDEQGGWADRPQYAQWETAIKDPGREDAVYFAWHTNALNGTAGNCDGTARGLTSYRSSSATAASTTFQTIMHDKTYNALNTLWFTGETWTVRSKNVTNFGENNQTSMGTATAGFLYEGLFHDNSVDTNGYNDPRFRYIAARSIVQGIVDYFNQRDAQTKIYPPEPPVNFRVEMLADGQAKLTWSAGPAGGFNGAAATGYKVQRSTNGFGFDNGTAVAGTTVTFDDVPTDGVQYFRVVAVNAGGESISTETLAGGGSGPDVLLVNGFDRNQRSLVPLLTITNLGTVRRLDPRNFQAFNYVVEHGEALEPLGVRVSSACNEVVSSAAVPLAGYDAVIWIAGEESTNDDVLSAAEQARVSPYLSGGGKFMISGAEIGWDLGRSGSSSAEDLLFFNGTLHAGYVGDDANTYNVSGTTGSFFQSVGAFGFATGSGARYDAEYPDTLAVNSGSQIAFTYTGGATAGVSFSSGNTKTVVLGFPFETIATAQQRATVMAKIVEFFDLQQEPVPQDGSQWMFR